MSKFLTWVLLSFVLWFASVQAANYVLGYSSVDAWEIRWWWTTKYTTPFANSINTWNALGKVNIAPDTYYTIEDVTVSDTNQPNVVWTWMWTYNYFTTDTLVLNTAHLDYNTTAQQQNTITHELGHALWLDHSISANIMYSVQTTRTALWTQDRADYAYLYGY